MRQLYRPLIGAAFCTISALYPSLVAGLIILVTCGAALPPASKPTASAVVEKINSDAFYEFRSVPMEGPYSAVVMSPLLRGNAAFAISMGSNDSPTAQEQVNERAFVSAFSAVPGRRLATRVWVLTPGEN